MNPANIVGIGGRIADWVNSNHLSRSATTTTSTTTTYAARNDFLMRGMAGNENTMPLARELILPTNFVLFGAMKLMRRLIMFQGKLGVNVGGNFTLSYEDDPNTPKGVRLQSHTDSAGHASTPSVYGYGEYAFQFLVKTGATARFYGNGDWNGDSFSSNHVPPKISRVGYYTDGDEYNISSDELFGAAAVWSGTPTLDQLRAIETDVRNLLKVIPDWPQYDTTIGAINCTEYAKPVEVAKRLLHAHLGYTVYNKPNGVLVTVLDPSIWWRGTLYFSLEGKKRFKVTIEGAPASRMVRLHDRFSGYVVAQKVSTPDGFVTFDYIDQAGEYYAVALDHERKYNAVVSDLP